MDIKALLPLLLSGNKNSQQIAPILNMMNGNNGGEDAKSAVLSSIMNSAGNKIPPEILASAMKNGQNKSPSGISPILGIVNDDILGKIIRCLSVK